MVHYLPSFQQLRKVCMPLINQRELTTYTSISEELKLELNKNYLFDLSYLGCLDILGEHNQDFLQGQLSCDVREVTSTQMRPGLMCNLKGRILTSLNVVQWHGLHLIAPVDLLVQTESSLAKTAVFSQVKIVRNTAYEVFGFYFQNQNISNELGIQLPLESYSVVSNDLMCAYHLGEQFYIILVDKKQADRIREMFISLNQWKGSLAWHALQLRRLHVEVYPESRGMFLPHRLGLQSTGHISFNKGCYKGQEIIARMHYRTKPKHELQLFKTQTSIPLQSGLRLFHDGLEVGELVDFCPIDSATYLCVVSILLDCPKHCTLEGYENVLLTFAGSCA